jgi:hypothetical protein
VIGALWKARRKGMSDKRVIAYFLLLFFCILLFTIVNMVEAEKLEARFNAHIESQSVEKQENDNLYYQDIERLKNDYKQLRNDFENWQGMWDEMFEGRK